MLQRQRRMHAKILDPSPPVSSLPNSAKITVRRFGALSQHSRQFQHRSRSRSVVIGAVVNVVSINRMPHSQVIEMGREQHRRVVQVRIATVQDAERIPGVFCFAGRSCLRS